MSPTLDLIRKRLVEQVGGHCGAHPHAYAPDRITATPCVFIGSLTSSRVSMDGAKDLDCKLYFFAKAGGDQHLAELDGAVLGDRSMADAIDEDPTLGLAGVLVTYEDAGDYSLHEWAGGPYWGVMLELKILL